jgi:hypothetical protein
VDGEAKFPRWGTEGEPLFSDDQGNDSQTTRSCPRRQVTDESAYLLSLYSHYRAGHLLEAGGVNQQPAKFMTAMQIIEGALA